MEVNGVTYLGHKTAVVGDCQTSRQKCSYDMRQALPTQGR